MQRAIVLLAAVLWLLSRSRACGSPTQPALGLLLAAGPGVGADDGGPARSDRREAAPLHPSIRTAGLAGLIAIVAAPSPTATPRGSPGSRPWRRSSAPPPSSPPARPRPGPAPILGAGVPSSGSGAAPTPSTCGTGRRSCSSGPTGDPCSPGRTCWWCWARSGPRPSRSPSSRILSVTRAGSPPTPVGA